MKVFLLTQFLLLVYSLVLAQKITISGTVRDAGNGEALIGANVYDVKSRKGATTNNFGFFSYTPPDRNVELIFSYVG